MSLWCSFESLPCYETAPYEGMELLTVDIAKSPMGYVRIGIHTKDEWLWSVMFDESQLPQLIKALQYGCKYMGRDPLTRWQKIFKFMRGGH